MQEVGGSSPPVPTMFHTPIDYRMPRLSASNPAQSA